MSTNRKKTSDNDVKAVGFIEEFIYKENDRTALLESIQTEIKSMRNDVLEIRLKRDLSISRNEKIKLKAEANAPFDMYQRDINSFFEHIQSAVSDYLHYELMAKSRTTIGDSRKELQKISLKARELSHMLKTISPSSEKEIMMRGWISPENLPDQLDELIYVIDNNIISNIDKKKSLLKTIHPKRLLSRKVIDGLCELKVLPLFESIPDIKNGKILDFIYDRPSELVLFNIECIHPNITAGLFFAHQIYDQQPKDILVINPYRARQKAVMQSREHEHTIAYLNTYGVYRSSVSKEFTLQIGDDFTLNGQERKAFNEYRKIRHKQIKPPEAVYNNILNQLI